MRVPILSPYLEFLRARRRYRKALVAHALAEAEDRRALDEPETYRTTQGRDRPRPGRRP